MRNTFLYCASLLFGSALLSATNIVYAQSPAPTGNRISDHFGFDGVDAIKVDKGGGPLSSTDLDGDGKIDLIAINNRNSRIDLLYQKVGAKPTDEVPPTSSIKRKSPRLPRKRMRANAKPTRLLESTVPITTSTVTTIEFASALRNPCQGTDPISRSACG